jgi:hypothetical protein
MKNNFQEDYIVAGNIGANLSGEALDTRNGVGVAFTANITGGGSPVGVLHIDGKIGDGEWVSITSKAVSADGDFFIEKTDWLYEKTRLRYVRASGTGTINAQACTKGF